MDLKGIFTPNTIAMPQWKNKNGENEFEKLLNQLAEMGKKLQVTTKKADIPMQIPSTEENMVSVQHYDATPRPLGEIFHNQGQMSEQAIAKARDIVGTQIAKLNLPSSDVFYLKSDISRFGGDGTPATGRISFQVPFLTPLGDQRTIYTDVDILMGSLMPPRQFFDSMNHRYAFTEDGLKEYLHGTDFEVLQNTKIEPETTYFESPGHLAGRGGVQITKYANIKKADEYKLPEYNVNMSNDAPKEQPDSIEKALPGDPIAEAISGFEKTEGDIIALQKEINIKQKELDKVIKDLPQAGELAKVQKSMKDTVQSQKDALSQIEALLGLVKDGMVENKGRVYKLQTKEEKSKTPLYTGVVGKLISLFPDIKGYVDDLWENVRTMTKVKSLVRESPTEEPKEWEIRKEAPKKPDVPLYEPPAKEGVMRGKMSKKASLLDSLQSLVASLVEMDAILDEAGV